MSPENMFQAIISVALYSGIVPLSRKRSSKFYNVCGLVFLVCSLVWIAVSFVLVSSKLQFDEGGEGNIGLCIAYCYTIIIIIFYIIYGKNVANNFEKILVMTEQLCTNTTLEKLSFEKILIKHSNKINHFIKYRFWYCFFLIPANVAIKILNRTNVIQMKNENNLIHAVNFHSKDSLIFWPTLTLQSVGLQLVIIIKTFNDLYILNVILMKILAFKYLRFKLGSIINKNSKKLFREQKLNSLIKDARQTAFDSKYLARNPSEEEGDMTVQLWIATHNSLLR